VADRHPGVDGMRTDVSEIIAYRAYCAFFWIGWFRIIVGNVLVGVSQIRLHIRAAPAVFTRRLRCGREEKRREEKRREEKRREEKRREEKVFCGLDSFSTPYIGLTG
ncbi:TPA: hypothetical protein AABU70_001278, partial [Neisseria gonorrhoeae]